ncbi:hypothetical protein KSS87_018226 [Heliosperma pusillum]|nr:hypothetical protein KSS87_018226 [Heliosperma pusillum]
MASLPTHGYHFTLVVENKKKLFKASTDVILNFPPNIVQEILESLPLRDAARTSILSRDWRHKWLSLPQITLDLIFSEAFRKRENAALDFPRVYSDAINKILLRHRGPIHKFVFDVPCHLPKASDIGCWIEFVCVNGVKEFYLNDHRLPKLKPPSCLFSCVSLTHLTLYCGSLSVPPTFRGFPCLISLKLDTCEDDNEKLESLIKNSPQLENLELVLGEAINSLTIRGSKLQHLVLECVLNILNLEETGRLKTLALDIETGDTESMDMVALLSSLPNIEKLRCLSSFHGCGLEPPKSLAKDLQQLHSVTVCMSLSCQYTVSFILCLFKSSPLLSRLKIEALICRDCEGKLLEFDDSCSLKPLKHIELVYFSGLRSELQVVKFLLAHSPTLESMTIELEVLAIRGLKSKFDLAKEVTRFRRASPNAEVVLKA